MRYAIIVAILPALAGCQQPAGTNPPVTEAQAAQIAAAAEATFTSGDLGTIMDQYADRAVMIDAATVEPSSDRKIQSGWAKTFVSMKPADYQVASRHIQLVGPDAFVSSGIERFTVEAGAARPMVSARFTDVFQRQKDGRWKIIAEHVSMPPTPAGAPQ